MTPPPTERDIRLATFPTADAVFAAFVRGCWTGLDDRIRRDPAALEAAIRRWHRAAVVRQQHDVAQLGDTVWYVYRDGRAGARQEEGWWQAPGVARVRFDASGVFLEANEAADALTGRSLRGARWTDLVAPEAREGDGAWIWQTLARDGHIQSVFELPRDSGPALIEYRSEASDRPGEYVGYWRELTTTDVADI